MSLSEIIAKSRKPLSVADLTAGFRSLGIEAGQTVLCHSSLSSFGWICGGAPAFVEALETQLATERGSGGFRGIRGTLVMPAQTGDLSAPMLWSNPPVPETWWQPIIDTMPAFDAAWTPSAGVGAAAEAFRTQPGSLRSRHPQVSFCGRGKMARRVLRGHSMNFGLGESTPLSKLYDLDASILMAGTSWATCTALHLAEHRCDWSWKVPQNERAPVYLAGKGIAAALRRLGSRAGLLPRHSGMKREWISISAWNLSSDDFEDCGKAFEKAHPDMVRRVTIGNAVCTAVPLRAAVDFAVSWLPAHRNSPGIMR